MNNNHHFQVGDIIEECYFHNEDMLNKPTGIIVSLFQIFDKKMAEIEFFKMMILFRCH
jgi:hypothetical protein